MRKLKILIKKKKRKKRKTPINQMTEERKIFGVNDTVDQIEDYTVMNDTLTARSTE